MKRRELCRTARIKNNVKGKKTQPPKSGEIRKSRKERGRKRSKCVANPYKSTKTTLDGTKRGSLQSLEEEVERHL